MPIYYKLGNIPSKRHVVFKSSSGKLYYEQLFGTEGFSGMSSLLYHIHRPTQIKEIVRSYSIAPKIAVANNIKPLLLSTFQVPPKPDYLESRTPLMLNNDCIIGVAAPQKSVTDYFFKNADADEMLFIHKGKGVLKTFMGEIPFEYGDYLIIPRGMIYQIHFETTENRLLYLESYQPIYTPKRYRNSFGQLLEHSPFCE